MKRLFSFLSVNLFVLATVFGQGMAVTNAVLFLQNGQLDKAKEQIDKASEHEKTSQQAKTWYYKGLIYQDLASSEKEELKSLAPNGIKQAFEAYNKAIILDKPNGDWKKQSTDKLEKELWAHLVNAGINHFYGTSTSEKKTEEAIEYLESAAQIKPTDTTAYVYAVSLAETGQKLGLAKKYYEKLIELKYPKPTIYYNYAWVLENEDKNYDKALKILEMGREAFPSFGKFIQSEISIYLTLNKMDEAKAKMEKAIEKDPKNPVWYASLGIIHDKKGEDAKAIEYYKKALTVDPSNFEANFNLGANYYNKAAKIYTEVNNMSLQAYQKEGKKKEDQAAVFMKEGLPYIEAAYNERKNDEDTKSMLREMYKRLKLQEKLNALN